MMMTSTGVNSSPTIVVTLVHGTWSSPLKWPQSSRLRTALEKKLAGARVESFLWSGRNRNADRIEAEIRLTAQLDQQLAAFPDAKQFVVAHSHGAQVALYALRKPNLAGRIAGVVAMGSPFLIARPRNTKVFRANFWRWFGLRLGTVVLITAIFGIILLNWPLNLFALLPVVGLLVIGSFPSLSRRFKRECYRRLSRWIRVTQRDTAAALGFDGDETTPLLFITAFDDEAYWVLRIEGGISQFVVWAYVAVSVSVALAAVVGFVGLPLALVAELIGFDGAALAALSGLSGIWLPIAAIGLLFFELLFLPLMMILAANGLAFGWDKLGTYLWSRVMVYRRPRHCSHLDYQKIKLRPGRLGRFGRGLWAFFIHRRFGYFGQAFWGLIAHCAYYDDERCADVIANWLDRIK
jgi:pimeloyl-ACP methyl ester carboxylesterase